MGFILAATEGNGFVGLIFILILVLFMALILRVNKKSKRNKAAQMAAQDAAKAAYTALSPEDKANLEAEKEREKKYFSGTYLCGHPDLLHQIPSSNCQVTEDSVFIYSTNGSVLGPLVAKIPVAEIQNVVVEDKSTVEKRVTMTRLVAVGVLALAAQKKEVHMEYYLIFSWGSGKIGNETIFEFDGDNAQMNANILRSAIAKRVNSLSTV